MRCQRVSNNLDRFSKTPPQSVSLHFSVVLALVILDEQLVLSEMQSSGERAALYLDLRILRDPTATGWNFNGSYVSLWVSVPHSSFGMEIVVEARHFHPLALQSYTEDAIQQVPVFASPFVPVFFNIHS